MYIMLNISLYISERLPLTAYGVTTENLVFKMSEIEP